VRNDTTVDMSHSLTAPVGDVELIVNLRAEADPIVLQSAVNAALGNVQSDHARWNVKVDHMEHFRPGKPQPTHRFAEA
jgi:hypothetical protein